MADDTFIFSIRASTVRQVLAKIDKNCASYREANIQTDKLDRMVAKFRKKFSFKKAAAVLAGGGSAKVLRRKVGVEMRKLDQQANKVNRLMEKVLEEDFFRQHPTGHARKDFRKAMAMASRAFEKKLYEASREFRKHVLAAAAEMKQLSK